MKNNKKVALGIIIVASIVAVAMCCWMIGIAMN